MPNADVITLVLDIILYVVLGLIVLKSFIGLFKGLWKEICSFVVSLIFYILVIVFNTSVTEAIYNFDLSFIGVSFTLNEEVISLTTIGETIRDVIINLVAGTANISEHSSVFKTCDALSLSILSFVVLIINILIVAFVVAPFISFLLYHCVFKFILGRNVTKKHKVRIAGFFVGMLKATITSALFLTPFTALCNTVSTVANEYEFNGNAEPIKKYVNAYNDSALAKVFTSVKFNETSLDISLTNYATTFFIDDKSTNFLSELSLVADIACNGIQEGIITLDSSIYDVSKLISKEFVTNVLIKLADSPVVVSLLPVALSIVVNLDDIKGYGLENVDWYEIEWGDELKTLSSVYSEFYETGLMDCFIDTDELGNYQFDRSHAKEFKNTFSNLSKVETLKKIMPYLMNSFVKSLEGGDYEGLLPVGIENYENIDIGSELSCVYDALLVLSDLSNYVFNETTLLNTKRLSGQSDGRYYLKINDLIDETRRNELINFLISSDAINGGNESVKFISSDGKDICTEMIFNGNTDSNGLLDCQLISENIDVLLRNVLENNENLSKFHLADVLDEIGDVDWKDEVKSLLGICSVLVNNEKLPLDNIDIFNQEQVNELKKIGNYIDGSRLVPKMLNPILSEVMKDEKGNSVELFGLTIDSLRFDVENLGEEFISLLDVLPKINEIQNGLNSGFNAFFDENSTLVDNLEEVLSVVLNSSILNNSEVKNDEGLSNFEVLIQNVFNMDSLVEAGFSELETSYLKNTDWEVEIANICGALDRLKDNETIKNLMNGNTGLDIINSQDVKDLISDFSSSKIINNSMGSILNKYLASSITNMGLEIEIDFCKVDDWDEEANSLCEAIDALKVLTSEGENGFSIALDNINISSLRQEKIIEGKTVTAVDELEDILKSLSKLSSLNDNNGKTNFGDIVYNLTESILGAYIDDDSKEIIKLDHNFSKNYVYFNESEKIEWSYDGDSEAGQYVLNDIFDLIRHILFTTVDDTETGEYVYFSEGLTEFSVDAALNKEGEIETLLEKLNNIYIWRTIIGDLISTIVDEAVNSFSNKEINLSLINKNVIKKDLTYNCDMKETRSKEISDRLIELKSIAKVYESISKLKLEGDVLEQFKDEGAVDNLGTMLKDMVESRLFNTVSDDSSNTTFFQHIIAFMLNKTGISEMMAFENDRSESSSEYALNAVMSVGNEFGINNKWRAGEIDKFTNAIKAATKVIEMFNGSISSPSIDIDGENVKNVISTFANSKVLNYRNSLGNILNKQIKSLFDETGLNIDFTKVGEYKPKDTFEIDTEWNKRVDEWNKEANNLNELITNLKRINNNNSLEFSIDLSSIDTDNLSNLFKSVYNLRVVQNNHVYVEVNEESMEMDNFGYFVYTQVTDKAFGSYLTEEEKEKVLIDHNIDIEKYKYFEDVNISWNTSNEKENYTNEIDNIMSLIGKLKNDALDENGNFIVSNFIVSKDLVEALNKNYIFRSVIKPLLKSQIENNNGLNDESVTDLRKIYLSAFDVDYNYQSNKKTRKEEVISRSTELGYLVDILNEVNTITSIDGMNDISSKIGYIKNFLKTTYKSKLFNKNENDYKEKFTVFEDLVKYVMDKSQLSGISDYGVFNTAALISKITEADTDTTKENNLHWLDKNENSTKVLGEISKLCNVLEKASSSGLTSLDEVGKIDSTKVEDLLNTFNVSYLCHYAVPNVVNKIYAKTGISEYALDKDHNPIDPHKLDNNKSFNDQVIAWKEDIEEISKIYDTVKNISEGGFKSIIMGEGDTINGFDKIIKYIGKSQHLFGNRADIIYGIFKDAGIDSNIYVSKINDTDTEDLSRRRTIQKLIDYDKFDWGFEGEQLDKIVSIFNSYKLTSDVKEIDNTELIKTVMKATYISDENNSIQRAYLASELISGFIGGTISMYLEGENYYDWRNSTDFNNEYTSMKTPDFTYESICDSEIDGFIATIEFASQIGAFSDNKELCEMYKNWVSNVEKNIILMDKSVIALKLVKAIIKDELPLDISLPNRKINNINELWNGDGDNEGLKNGFYILHQVAMLGGCVC